MTFNSGPINIEQGNTANFSVEFRSSANSVSSPSTTNMTIAYTNLSNGSNTDTIALTPTGSIYLGVWSSVSAALGLATWAVTATGGSSILATGQIRVIQRMSTY